MHGEFDQHVESSARGLKLGRLEHGAQKVYATARYPESIDIRDPGVTPLHLYLLDVTLLVNNAGIATGANLLTDDLHVVRQDLETQPFDTLRVIRAFAPALAVNGGGAIVSILSVLSWVATAEGSGSYSVAKAAKWNMTNAGRVELAAQKTLEVPPEVPPLSWTA